jgi:hypothetical protein
MSYPPRTAHPTNVRLDTDTLAKINQLAQAAYHGNRSQALRAVIEAGLRALSDGSAKVDWDDVTFQRLLDNAQRRVTS